MDDLKLAWRRSSPNYFTADIGPATVEVCRPKTWKKYAIPRPWHVGRVLGVYHGGREMHATPESAMAEAETVAFQMIQEIKKFLEEPRV